MLTLLYAVAIGLGMAVTRARLAAHRRRQTAEGAAEVAGQTIWISLGTAALVAAIGVAFAPAILHFMGAEPT